MMKIPKQDYTQEFRELAVKRVKSGQPISAVSKDLGLVELTLRNWVKAAGVERDRVRIIFLAQYNFRQHCR